MNIRDLQYFVAVADYHHFGKAAGACFVSQPALSMQIKKLEESLGVQLIERTNKSVLLTTTGLAIAERARIVLNQVEDIRETANLAKDPYSGDLNIGIFPTLAPYLLPTIVPSLTRKYPKLSLYLIEDQTKQLIEKLKSGNLHAAFLALPIDDASLTAFPLFDEEFLLATPKNHALATHRRINQKDLDNKKLLLLEEGHCLREQALAVCNKLNAHETQNFRATSLETLRNMVAANAGITLIPKLACHASNNIRYIPFSGSKPKRSIALVWRQSSAKIRLLSEMTFEIQKILKNNKQVKVTYSTRRPSRVQ